MIDAPATVVRLTDREVRGGSRDGIPTKIAVARRTYRTDPQDLWEAVTDPERLPRWFLPVSGELEPGGRYQLEGNAGGTIQRCDRPESLAVTWEFGEMVSWLELNLVPADDGTTLELVHESPVDPQMWDQFGPGAVGVGWDLALLGLGLHLDTGESVDPGEAATFTLSAQGLEFTRLAAAGWADAAIADGEGAAQARAASERTVAFYTTVPDVADVADGAEGS